VELVFQISSGTAQSYGIFEARRDWDSGEATWTQATTGVAWEVAGARGASDCGSTQLGSFAPASAGSYTLSLNSAGVQVVQGWGGNASANRGFIIANTHNGDGVITVSGNSPTASERPKLRVTSPLAQHQRGPLQPRPLRHRVEDEPRDVMGAHPRRPGQERALAGPS
jgi:hypothetical protein